MTTPPSDRNFFDDSEDDSEPTPDFNLNNRFSGQEKSAQEHWDMIQDRLIDRWETPLPNPPENCADPLEALKPHVEEFGAESFYGCVFKSESHRLEHDLIPESIWLRMACWPISNRKRNSDSDGAAKSEGKELTYDDATKFLTGLDKWMSNFKERLDRQAKYKWNDEGTFGWLIQDVEDKSNDRKSLHFGKDFDRWRRS